MMLSSLLILALHGCEAESEWPEECESLCDTLVFQCEYEAYPSEESCLEGCVYDIELGRDVAGEAACVGAAECDLFEIIECQNAAGE